MKKITAFILAILAVLALVSSACTVKPAENDATQPPDPETAAPTQGEPATPTPAVIETPAASENKEIVLTKENFDEMIAGDTPILVDFWAIWCGPCMMLAPTVEKFANNSDGSYRVGKVNVDEQPSITMRYGVSSIPTLIVFKNGEEISRTVGAVDMARLLELVGK